MQYEYSSTDKDRSPWTYEFELWIGTKEDTVFRWDAPEAPEGGGAP